MCSFALRSRDSFCDDTKEEENSRVFVVWRQNRGPFFEWWCWKLQSLWCVSSVSRDVVLYIKDEEEEEGKKDSEDFLSLFFVYM